MTSPLIRTLTELHRDDCACPRCLPLPVETLETCMQAPSGYLYAMPSDDEPAPEGWHRVARWER